MKNAYEVRGDVTAIFLKRADGVTVETLIDTDDLPIVLNSDAESWSPHLNPLNNQYYVIGNLSSGEEKGKKVKLHRLLTNAPPDKEVDHKNHDTLDNRRSCNLRVVTHGQNVQNRKGAYKNSKSGVRGVHWHIPSQKWIAKISVNGMNRHLGSFERLEDAEIVVKEARAVLMPFSAEATNGQYDVSKIVLPPLQITHRPPSGVPGVSWKEKNQKWQANLTNKYIGLFDTVAEAAEAIERARGALAK